MFVFALVFAAFAVPRELQHRVLFWGVAGGARDALRAHPGGCVAHRAVPLDHLRVRGVPGVHGRPDGVPERRRTSRIRRTTRSSGSPSATCASCRSSTASASSSRPRSAGGHAPAAGAHRGRDDRPHLRGRLHPGHLRGHDRPVHRVHQQRVRDPGPAVALLPAGRRRPTGSATSSWASPWCSSSSAARCCSPTSSTSSRCRRWRSSWASWAWPWQPPCSRTAATPERVCQLGPEGWGGREAPDPRGYIRVVISAGRHISGSAISGSSFAACSPLCSDPAIEPGSDPRSVVILLTRVSIRPAKCPSKGRFDHGGPDQKVFLPASLAVLLTGVSTRRVGRASTHAMGEFDRLALRVGRNDPPRGSRVAIDPSGGQKRP